ncbi:unnamed protein product [Rotaria socialis]|uniref:Reverse transcriptase domain-containing protein n=1 Tax=Rotaria socialis TaxID=392032 RepID=A0A820TXD6_9BILA|nr:unnamed protein product [Rotaria socialis]CAF4477655.1 unnamed protein product [Rotaria socialis]
MLIKGLKYIPPCQSRFSRQSIDAIVNEQYTTLRPNIQGCLDDHRMQLIEPREKEGFPSLKRMLYELQSKKLPRKLRIRARRERKVVQSILKILHNRPDIIIRRTDKSKVFYIGNATVFTEKASKYMLETEAYREISNEHCILSENHHLVISLLGSLLKNGAINQEQYRQISPSKNRSELAHLHFIPKPHKPDTPLRPIVAAIHAPATQLSKFLNDLLAPVFLRVARETTFINGIDLVRTLEKYVIDKQLKPTTLFVSFDVENLYTMIPRQGALIALIEFLERYLPNKRIGTFSINDIVRMARLVLDTNVFVYENKYFRQIRGGAMGSAFTQTLANIYMFEWEQDLLQIQQANKEIYGRYIDDVFMTTNVPFAQIKDILERANKKDPNIRISYCIQSKIDFLDVTVTNDNGHLTTSIFHKSATEPYILPYTSDHPRHVYNNIPYAALLRAARICSNVGDFEMERVRIDLSLLLNEYPPSFISKHFIRFFEMNNATSVLNGLNTEAYHALHQKLLHQPTRREKQMQANGEDINPIPDVLKKKKPWDPNVMYAKYNYESGPRSAFQHKFRTWWKTHFGHEASSVEHVHIKFAVKTNRTLEDAFVNKRPPRHMLLRKPTNVLPPPESTRNTT